MKKSKKQISNHLSNEQTFLSWLRTGIEVMAFGFVAIKFALFASQIIGILLVVSGAVMTILSYFRYRVFAKQLKNDSFVYSGKLVAVSAFVIVAISAALIYYLIDAYFNPEVRSGSKPQSDELVMRSATTKTALH